MLLKVVHEVNRPVRLLDPINRDTHLAITGGCSQDGDVVDRLPIPVMDREPLPLRREARRKS